jgi:hypothetical protein
MKHPQAETAVKNTGQAAAELDALLPAIAKRLKDKGKRLNFMKTDKNRIVANRAAFNPLAFGIQPLAFVP